MGSFYCLFFPLKHLAIYAEFHSISWNWKYQLFNDPTSVLSIFLLLPQALGTSLARLGTSLTLTPFHFNETVTECTNEIVPFSSLCAGGGRLLGGHPRPRPGEQSSKNWQEILRMNPGGRLPKSKRERGFCWNTAIWLKPLPVCSQKCQSHVQGFHILPSILKAGSLPWNNEILHFLFYQNLSNLKKNPQTQYWLFSITLGANVGRADKKSDFSLLGAERTQ